jgi:hypothetical protein
MRKTENEQKTKPKLDNYAKQLAGTVFPCLRVYKSHFFDKNLPSKVVVRLIHGIKKLDPPRKRCYPIDERAHDAGVVCCETPSRDR